jgi:hypothetical protein
MTRVAAVLRPSGGDAGFLALTHAMTAALRAGRIEEADARYHEMCELRPAAREMLVFPVLIAIQRGDTLHALQQINQRPEGSHAGLRALCLRMLGDPSWVGEAKALVDSPDVGIAHAMRQLLGDSPGGLAPQ